MDFETIEFSVSGNVAHLILSRPDIGNAVNMTMAEELRSAAQICRDDEHVRAVLLSSRGRMFCAGGDVGFLDSLGDDGPDTVKAMAHTFHEAMIIFSTMDAPVVAAIQGMAAGGGVSIAMMSSIAVASEQARFVAAYSQVGLSPDGSLTYFLPRHVGLRVAEEFILSNRIVEADEAQKLGMVNEVVAHDALMDRALEITRKLASGPTRAYGAARRLLLQSMNSSLQEQLDREAETVSAFMDTAVFKKNA